MGQWSIQDSRSCSGPSPDSNDVINDGKAEGEPRDSQATLPRMRMMPRLVRVMLNLRG